MVVRRLVVVGLSLTSRPWLWRRRSIRLLVLTDVSGRGPSLCRRYYGWEWLHRRAVSWGLLSLAGVGCEFVWLRG